MVRAKVNIETSKRKYEPGEIISENLSAEDMNFLKRRGFVTVTDEDGEDESEQVSDTNPNYDPVEGIDLSFMGMKESQYRDEDTLKKMNKEEIVAYAAQIGLTLSSDSLKAELIDAVLNYQEEKMEE